MKDNLTYFGSFCDVQLLRKPYSMVIVFYFLDPMLCFVCSPFRTTCSEGAVCGLFLNIYFFNMLSTCQQKQNRQKRAVFEDC